MSLLLSADALAARRVALGDSSSGSGSTLAPLADSLRADLEPVLARDVVLPPEKARLTRRGGRCEVDGTLLEFDPFSPRLHRCATCGRTFSDESHYRWWIMGYHLWLSERAVHAAALFAIRRERRHRSFAERVLEAYAERYLEYPNRDNVLGPTRPFFSTYLESIWLLQLAIALDLLESSVGGEGNGDLRALASRARDRVLEPSATLIAGFDEGMSNRQVWNNAALLAARHLLGRGDRDAVLRGPSGLEAHLSRGLLADGTWYEGENYHLFAHRGLWYGVRMAERLGDPPSHPLRARFQEAFATPFVTALPDFTFPARRDAQYRVSLRQWRFAELAELGLVGRPDDARLLGALAELYDPAIPRGDTARSRSTGEAERNVAAAGLDRADLGWRSLLHARTALPALQPWQPGSVVLEAQGLAILRRDAGRLYAALDYGHSGAGHGHPDRLNVLLVHGAERWLDDVGTGSYVDPSLHWYRSTLAHNAPLVNGRSQERVHGRLIAYDERGGAGWATAAVDGIGAGVHVERALVVMPDFLVDELTWHSESEIDFDLPIHAPGTLRHPGPWRAAAVSGGSGAEDGFAHLTETEVAPPADGVTLEAAGELRRVDAFIIPEGGHLWWRAVAPGPPGEPPRRFHVVRQRGRRGVVTSVWSWSSRVKRVARADGVVAIELHDGTRQRHWRAANGWHVELHAAGARSSIHLGGLRAAPPSETPVPPQEPPARAPFVIPRFTSRRAPGSLDGVRPLVFELGESHYRRSEPSWVEAGAPTARVSLWADAVSLRAEIDVRTPEPCFAARVRESLLDNEHPDLNSDGVQVHLSVPSPGDSAPPTSHTWLLVPEPEGGAVRITERVATGPRIGLDATWSRTSTGYTIRCALPLSALQGAERTAFGLDILVNDFGPGRERRRGQLVLGGAAGEFVYLRGDRQPTDLHLPFVVADV